MNADQVRVSTSVLSRPNGCSVDVAAEAAAATVAVVFADVGGLTDVQVECQWMPNGRRCDVMVVTSGRGMRHA